MVRVVAPGNGALCERSGDQHAPLTWEPAAKQGCVAETEKGVARLSGQKEQALSVRVVDPQELPVGEVSAGRLPQRDQAAVPRRESATNDDSSTREIGRSREELTDGAPGGMPLATREVPWRERAASRR